MITAVYFFSFLHFLQKTLLFFLNYGIADIFQVKIIYDKLFYKGYFSNFCVVLNLKRCLSEFGILGIQFRDVIFS